MLAICLLRPEEKREVPEHYPYPDLKAPFVGHQVVDLSAHGERSVRKIRDASSPGSSTACCARE